MPRGEWTQLIPSLLPKVAGSESDTTKRATLQTIGFICEILDPNILETQSNAILTAVAEGARKEQTRYFCVDEATKSVLPQCRLYSIL